MIAVCGIFAVLKNGVGFSRCKAQMIMRDALEMQMFSSEHLQRSSKEVYVHLTDCKRRGQLVTHFKAVELSVCGVIVPSTEMNVAFFFLKH